MTTPQIISSWKPSINLCYQILIDTRIHNMSVERQDKHKHLRDFHASHLASISIVISFRSLVCGFSFQLQSFGALCCSVQHQGEVLVSIQIQIHLIYFIKKRKYGKRWSFKKRSLRKTKTICNQISMYMLSRALCRMACRTVKVA